MENQEILSRLVSETGVSSRQINAVETLLKEGSTIPFIARYRKEAHGNLDEVQIGKIKDRLEYYNELEERKSSILKSIDSQGKLDDDLREKILACYVKTKLEDLYQPYKPKRRTRAQVAKEKGFEPLADSIWNGESFASTVTEEDLQFARDILAERIADIAEIRGLVRNQFAEKGVIKTSQASLSSQEPTKFEQYYDFSEQLSTMPSHRYLAIRRGQAEKVLFVHLEVDKAPIIERMLEIIKMHSKAHTNNDCFNQLKAAAEDSFKRLLSPSSEIDVTVEKKMQADRAAVEVFAENLRNLLLASPLGAKAVLAIDPGIRTGCKLAMMDSTGRYLGKHVIFPQQNPQDAEKAVAMIVAKYKPEAIAVGNGTAGRETETFVRQTMKKLSAQHPEIKIPIVVSVSEAGASVYSASEIARKEFPDLDLTVRGAISIGRRLQDPLAELVKIDPKAIGVGQYQHDVQQTLLGEKLDEVVVSCVNKVGVELNTASAPLLERVSGVGSSLAKAIVDWRDANGQFKSREDLRKVKGLGDKAFEQCAGFLRIRESANPLDASAVHPERYKLVEKMAEDIGTDVGSLVGDEAKVKKIDIKRYISSQVGELTLKDILTELVKPGRDPRKMFEPPSFRDDVMKIEDVKEGMKLEGVVTNVAKFGAFVDIGVHQDGLIHISEIADTYVSDPSSVLKVGDRISVTVIGVDRDRGRISLSAKSNPVFGADKSSPKSHSPSQRQPRPMQFGRSGGFSCNPFANL
jgi:uncharacterized protein